MAQNSSSENDAREKTNLKSEEQIVLRRVSKGLARRLEGRAVDAGIVCGVVGAVLGAAFSFSLVFFFDGSSVFGVFDNCAGTALMTIGLELDAMVERLARRSRAALLPQLAVAGNPGASWIGLEASLLSCRLIGAAAATGGPGCAGGAARDNDDWAGCCVWIEFIIDRS